MTQYSYWSQAELDALHALYPKQGALAVAKLVRGRTIRSIRTKAMKLGISTLARKPQSPPPGWDDLAARIVLRVSRSESGCWLWNGSLDQDGYGRMFFRGRNTRVCRVAWCASRKQDWPTGKYALHSCDNPRCVNPDHIRPGTNSENVKESWERGGHRKYRQDVRGECRNGHKYTPENTANYTHSRSLVCPRVSEEERA